MIRPAFHTEHALLQLILDGHFPPGSTLPAERNLAQQIGVTRPTLRETLGRLDRDGWIRIRHGKPTLVLDYLHDGGLNVLSTMIRFGHGDHLVKHLLEVRCALAPAYCHGAVTYHPDLIHQYLQNRPHADLDPDTFCNYDRNLHKTLTRHSENPVYAMIANGVDQLYDSFGLLYFQTPESRALSADFYEQLAQAAAAKDANQARDLTFKTMKLSENLWLTLGDKAS